jgi:putative transposase
MGMERALRRAEGALTTVVATCCLLGVSTRRMEKLVETLGISRLSTSQVSTIAAELDAQVADFRTCPRMPACTRSWSRTRWCLKVREGGRVVNGHALLATGLNGCGQP